MPDNAEEQIGTPAEDLPARGSSAPSNVVTLASGEVVTLYPTVPLALGMAAVTVTRITSRKVMLEATPFSDVETASIEGALAEIYLRFGIKEWTFRNTLGLPEPVTPESIERLLPYNGGGREVAEAASSLYSDEVFRPFREAQQTLLRAMQTAASTPPDSDSGTKRRAHSKRSSRNGTAGKRSGVRAR